MRLRHGCGGYLYEVDGYLRCSKGDVYQKLPSMGAEQFRPARKAARGTRRDPGATPGASTKGRA